MSKKKIKVIIGEAEAGQYLAVNGIRVCGMKPHGMVITEFDVDEDRLLAALRKATP